MEEDMRERALRRVREEKPQLLVGSPMCTAFSKWQRINDKIREPVTVAGTRKRAIMHLEFCLELYHEQIEGGRYFLHEHPAYASSWQTEAVMKCMKEPGVVKVIGDKCLYGC